MFTNVIELELLTIVKIHPVIKSRIAIYKE